MKIIILNWGKGDNDPFTYGNRLFTHYLRDHGRDSEIVDVEHPQLVKLLESKKEEGIECVLTAQGLGSTLTITPPGKSEMSLWDYLGIPLICAHADHPSIMPANHMLDSPLCKHLYYDDSACYFSNQYLRTKTGAAMTYFCPLDIYSPPTGKPEGRYFVLIKNLVHPDELEQGWKKTLSAEIFNFFMGVAEQIKAAVMSSERFVDFHDILDKAIAADSVMHVMHRKENYRALFLLHGQIDLYFRYFKSVELLKRMRDYPVRIFGKGWDKIKAVPNPNHEFLDGLNMTESKKLYYSEYGLLDVSPYRGFHDRSLRAIANETPFLTDTDLSSRLPRFRDYADLFYNFTPGTLEARCEQVMSNPARHWELGIAFSREYRSVNAANAFIQSLDIHMQSMRKP
ncbi:MAG TPA: hypothetical protein VFT64_03415 [Rickettsiales bacterium]|nr:hypothetical protein [Rickettsiales bacterium]